ncbi:MAG TPA: protein kinase, partial [Planctomycetota bacterium]|nr:protein kinase [Planctomycetota bacterium]
TADGPAAAPPPPLPAALLGSHFDLRFDLLGTIGAGSSGTVYRARLRDGYAELPAGSTVAVKFLRQDLAFDERARERLRSEGQLGLELRHPNVAAIFGIETFDLLGLPLTYLVMEYVAGTTLRTYLQQQGPPVEDLTRRIGADAAAGLQALHRRGMVHRDVKPENLVLTPAGQVKVVDLGLARPVGSKGSGSASSSAHGIAGSVAYTAPEALRGLPATPRSDLYALGVVLFEVATGRHPFAGKQTVDDMIDAHLRLPPPRPSHLRPRMSALLEQLILELLAKAPDQRPRDAAEVQRALQHGERAEWWRRHETQAPALASGRRLRRMRRQADAPFAGREAELAELDRLLAKARSGAGSVVCVQGPVGIGRRRLLDEAMARWLEAGSDLLVLGGEAEPMRGHGQPFADTLLDFLLRGDEAGSPNAVARAALAARTELQLGEADASALALAVTGRSQEAPEVHADRLASALLSLPRPRRLVVLRVDAADRLDTSARLALARLAAGAPGLQLLLLLTAGPDGLQLPGLVRIELQGLPEPAFLAFGRALFRGGEVGEALLHLAHGALSGSPGNLLEALDHLLQQEQLAGRPGDYHALAATAEVRPAPRHLERFRARVALLPLDQRNVLEAAAVLGERFPLADLAALVSQPELQILETLSLFRGRVIRAQGGDVAFRHRDFRQALLRAIPEAARTTLHHAAAALLQQRSASPLEIGMHLSMALDHEACIAPLLAGLQALVQRGSRRTSLRIAARLRVHFQALPRTPANERSRLSYLLLSARARANAQQTAAAAPLFEEALQLARQQDDHERSGDALTGLSACALDAGRLLAAVELLELAHAQLSPLQTESGNLLAARAHA